MTNQPPKTDPAAGPPGPDSGRSAYRAVLSETIYCAILGGLIGVHVGLQAVFFVTGFLLILCAGVAQWVRPRQVAPSHA